MMIFTLSSLLFTHFVLLSNIKGPVVDLNES